MEKRIFRKLRLAGAVQGVGFRRFLKRHADEVGATGWAKNESDGSLIVLIAATPAQMRRMEPAVRAGPPRCQIAARADLITEEHDIVTLPAAFAIR